MHRTSQTPRRTTPAISLHHSPTCSTAIRVNNRAPQIPRSGPPNYRVRFIIPRVHRFSIPPSNHTLSYPPSSLSIIEISFSRKRNIRSMERMLVIRTRIHVIRVIRIIYNSSFDIRGTPVYPLAAIYIPKYFVPERREKYREIVLLRGEILSVIFFFPSLRSGE